MSKIRSTIDSEKAIATSFTPTAPPNIAAGDAVCLLVNCKNTSNDISTSTSGWEVSAAKGTYGNNTLTAVYKLNVSASEAMPLLETNGSAADWYCSATALKDVPASAAVDIEVHGSTGFVGLTQGIPTATTGAPNTIGLWMAATSNWAETLPEAGSGVLGQDKNLPSSASQVGVSSGWWFEESSGVTSPSRDFWFLDAVRNRHCILISFKSDAGIKPPRCDVDTEAPWDLVCGFYSRNGYKGYSFNNVTTDIPDIDGITTYDAGGSDNRPGFGLNLYFSNYYQQPSSNGVDRMHIRELTLDDVYDATNKKLFFHVRFASGTDIGRSYPLDDHGIVIGLRSGTSGNEVYRFFDAIALDTTPAPDGMQIVVIDPTDTTHRVGADIGGTFDESDIRGIVPGIHQSSTQSITAYFTHCGAYNKLIGIGGHQTEGNYLDWSAFKGMLKKYDQTIEQLGDAFESKMDVQIGNGLSETHFNTNGQNFAFPNPADFVARQIQYQVFDNSERARFLLNTGSTARFDAVMDFKGGEIDLSYAGNVNATWDWAGGTWNDVGTWTVSNIGTITNHNIVDSADMVDLPLRLSTGVVLSGTKVIKNVANKTELDAALALLAGANIPDLEIYVTTAIDITTDFPENTTAGVYFENTADDQTLQLNVPDSSTVTSNGSASGDTLSIQASVDTQKLRSDTADTLIRFFPDNQQSGGDSTTGTELDYIFSTLDPIDVEFLKQGYVPINRQDVIPSNSTFDVVMDFDESYDPLHNLTEGVEYTLNRETDVLTLNSNQSALDVRSSVCDTIRTKPGFENTKLKMISIPGLTRVDLIDDLTVTVSNMSDFWKRAGMERYSSAAPTTPLAKWLAIVSVGDIAGATVQKRQVVGGLTANIPLTNDIIDQAIQYFADGSYDYSGVLTIKAFCPGKKQARVNVLENQGITALASNLYTIPLNNVDHGYTGTDPGISAQITLNTGRTVSGFAFDYELIDGGTNTGLNLGSQINWNAANNPNGLVPGNTGLRWFDLPDIIVINGDSIETEIGIVEDAAAAFRSFYVSRGGEDHPSFARFQLDANTYYVPPQQFNWNWPTILDSSVIRLYNKTHELESRPGNPELFNAIVSGGAGVSHGLLFGPGQEVQPGDQVDYTVCLQDGTNSYWPIVGSIVINSATDINLTDAQVLDQEATDVANAESWLYANIDRDEDPINGEIFANFATIGVEVYDPDNKFDCRKGVIWFIGKCATQEGIRVYNPNALIRSPDIRNIVVDGPILVSNVKPNSDLNVFGGLWSRLDGQNIIKPGGYLTGSSINWVPASIVYNGPTITLTNNVPLEEIQAAKTAALGAQANSAQAANDILIVDGKIDSTVTAANDAKNAADGAKASADQAVAGVGVVDGKIDAVGLIIAAIQTDTETNIPALIGAIQTLTQADVETVISGAGLSSQASIDALNTLITAVKAKTDLTPDDYQEYLDAFFADAMGDITDEGGGVVTLHKKDGSRAYTSTPNPNDEGRTVEPAT